MKNIFLLLVLCFAPSYAIEFECDFKNNTNWIAVGSVYTCTVIQINSFNDETSLESVIGNHINGNTNLEVQGLNVQNEMTMQQLPNNIEVFFPNLIFFNWAAGALTTVVADDIPFPELRVWAVSRNQIDNIDGDLFKFTPRLSHIFMYNNSITNVGPDLLALNELEVADFSYNLCVDFLAGTPEEIQELEQRLLIDCQPPTITSTISTSTSDSCDVRCSLDDEVDVLSLTISELERKVSEQNEWIAKSEERFHDLEEQIRNIINPVP